MSKKILITGGTGYIGSHLVNNLTREGYLLKLLLRNIDKVPEHLKNHQQIQILNGDLSNFNLLKEAISDVDVIFHLAAHTGMFEKAGLLRRTNILGLENILKACALQKRDIHFIFSSSIEAVGPSFSAEPVSQCILKPLSDYGVSKLEGERLLIDSCRRHHNIVYTIVRIGNVYGDKSGIIKGIEEMLSNGGWRASILFHTLKEYTLHLVHLDDLVNMLIRIIDNQKAKNKTYYLVNQSLSIGEIAKWLKENGALKSQVRKIMFERQILFLWNLLARITKSADLLTYISLGGTKRKFRNYDYSETVKDLSYQPTMIIKVPK